jgi:hypothetical protein
MVVTGARIPQPNLTGASPVTSAPAGPAIEIEAAPWNPDRPYLKALAAAEPGRFWAVYAEQEATSGDLPAFYLDVAEFLFRRGDKADAVRVLLGALEVMVADNTTLTIVADRLLRYGETDRAIWLYEQMLILEPDRPQPRRNLALALAARAEAPGASAERRREDYARALELLDEVVMTPWSSSWDAAWPISLMEANRIVPRARAAGVDEIPLDPRLVALLDVDLRVTMEWNVDASDMDLWVDEPTGERAIYSHPRTEIGGRLSRDLTQGYGPEEYLLRRAIPGVYTVRANVYARDRINPNGAITIRVRMFRNWGRPDEAVETLDVELRPEDARGEKLIGTLTVADPRRKR